MTKTRRSRRQGTRSRYVRPTFLGGVLEEPQLLFGDGNQHIDPKAGLAVFGPYSLVGQDAPSLGSITVGIVTTGKLLTATRAWLRKCREIVTNDGSQPFLFPSFPGMSPNSPIRCELVFGHSWEEQIPEKELIRALGVADYYQRLAAVVRLFSQGVQNLSERSPRPDVIVCAIPKDVLDVCTIDESYGERRRHKLTEKEKQGRVLRDAGQLALLPVAFGDEEEEGVGHRNLRRALKAETMAFQIPTQIIRESTLTGKFSTHERRSLQDEATRAWNFCTGLYYKAGGHPWRLAEMPPDTCYVGISFYRERLTSTGQMRTSLAQIFSHRSDGLVLRGRPFEWDGSSPSPHMDQDSAHQLMQDALALYTRHSGRPPLRVVVHKSSRYWENELLGFQSALADVPQADLVTFGKRGIQLFRHGNYPPLRGTWIKFDDNDFLLYTRGYIPFLRTYPGMRVPEPIEMIEHHGDSAPDDLLAETMALTKMNWNCADFACEEPMTLAFARRVGEILGEMPPGATPQAEYRFYM